MFELAAYCQIQLLPQGAGPGGVAVLALSFMKEDATKLVDLHRDALVFL